MFLIDFNAVVLTSVFNFLRVVFTFGTLHTPRLICLTGLRECCLVSFWVLIYTRALLGSKLASSFLFFLVFFYLFYVNC